MSRALSSKEPIRTLTKKAKPFNKTATSPQNPIWGQKGSDTTLDKNPDDGLYLKHCTLSGLFVSGSRCLPYNRKFIFDFRGADLFYRNKKYLGIVLKRTAHDILFRIGQISVKGNKHHDRICCQKGSDVVSIKRKPGWDILSVFPIRALDWEAADVPLFTTKAMRRSYQIGYSPLALQGYQVG